MLPRIVARPPRRYPILPEVGVPPIRPFESDPSGQVFEQVKHPSWKVTKDTRQGRHEQMPHQVHAWLGAAGIVTPIARMCPYQEHSVNHGAIRDKTCHKTPYAVTDDDSLSPWESCG